MKAGRISRWALLLALLLAAFLRQRRYPIPLPAWLSFLLENPVTEAFVGSSLLLKRLDLAPGMNVLDAGCGPGRLTIPVAREIGSAGHVTALDVQPAMLEKLRRRVAAEGLTNIRIIRAGLGEGALSENAFDREILAMTLGEVRNREAALRELHGALKPGGILSVTEAFGDPDYHRSVTVRQEAEAAGFSLVARYGSFPAYTLNFTKP